ncbi:MAG: T9SS type A sorting domain-containing protein [Saprospiraceae bacterium]|nr:T9SS type A sorting domain-containing protein [Saprospiraceae bacterium]
MPDNNFWYSAIVVLNNEIYRFGGGGYTGPVTSVHKYDSINDSWTSIANLPKALHAPAGVALGGKIYISGGYNAGPLDEVYVFDPGTSTFNTVNPLPGGRSYHDMVTVGSCIYSIGGNNSAFPAMNTYLIRNCNPYNVSVNEINSEKSIMVFPNPTSDYIYFETDKVLNVELFDLNVAKKLSIQLKNETKKIDISHLPEGIYFYRAYNNDGAETFVGKIIVVR